MRRAWVLSFVLQACTPQTPGESFPIELYVTAGLLDEISGFQISLVTFGSALECLAVQKACIKDQVDASRFVPLKDATGKSVEALRIPIELTVGSPNTQDLSLEGVPLGKDLALVVEAISRGPAPRLAGSACSYVKELTSGPNPPVVAAIEVLRPHANCDPQH